MVVFPMIQIPIQTGAIALAEYLAESPRVIRLDLRNNDIKFGGLMALSLAFKINFSLLRLDIDKPQSKETVSRQMVVFSNKFSFSNSKIGMLGLYAPSNR